MKLVNELKKLNYDVNGVSKRIEESKEKEIGIQIFLQTNCDFSKIVEVVEKCHQWNTYIMDR